VSSYLILGAGRFGRLAWQRLSERQPEARFCLVDHDPEKVGHISKNSTIETVTATATHFLAKALEAETLPDWIIPAIPRHVAFDWLWGQRTTGARWHQISVPAALGQDLPVSQRGPAGELYLSLSTVQCPDDCPEPVEKCYLTGLERTYNLYDYLENVSLQDYTSLVIRSRQLAPGVGGYRPADLWHLRLQVHNASGRILISTSCRCHGVSHALEKLTGTEAVVGF
jgi:hypothetical protein